MFLVLIILDITSALKRFQDISYGDGFGPLVVSWPRTWVVSRFAVDSNYIYSANKFDFYFSVDEIDDDISGYYAGVKFPDETDFTECTLSLYHEDANEDARDWIATCYYPFGIYLVYGPIDFILAKSENGQIVARDSAAGFIAFIDGAEPLTDYSLTVSYSDETETKSHVISAEDTLIFSFVLPQNGMYSGDFFALTPSSHFTYRDVSVEFDSTLYSSDAFASPSVYAEINNQDTTDTSDDTISSYYIYGCNGEVLGGSTITFTLKGAVNPSSVIDANSYGWELKVWRFGTKTIIASYSGEGPSVAVTKGTVTINDWSPTTSVFYKTMNILQGLKAYWTLSFKLEHDVPASGIILVDYAGVTINDYDLVTDAKQARKAYASNQMIFVSSTGSATLTETIESSTQAKIALGSSASLAAGSVVTLINYLKVVDTATSISVTVKSTTSGSKAIDQLATAQSVTVTTDGTSVLLTDPVLYIVESKFSGTEVTEINKSGAYGLVATFTTVRGFTLDDALDIYLPFVTGTASATKNLVGGSSLWGTCVDDTVPDGYTTAATGTAGIVTASSGKITYRFGAITTDAKQVVLFIGSGSSETATNFYTPFTSTLEPFEVVIKFTKGSKTYFGTTILSFTAGTITPTVEFLCLNVQVDGNPVKVSYAPIAWTIPIGATLKTSFRFMDGYTSMDLYTSSGLSDGDSYPASNKDMKIASDGTVYLSSTSSLTATAVSFTIPINSVTSTNKCLVDIAWTVTSISYGKSFVIYTGADDTSYSVDQDDGSSYGAPAAADFISLVNTASTATLTLKSAAAADINRDGESTDASVAVSSILILPAGFRTANSKFTANAMVSSNSDFPYNVYFATSLATLDEYSTSATTYSLDLIPSWKLISSGSTKYTFIYGAGADFSAARTCSTVQGYILITALGFEPAKYAPATSITYTYNSRTTPVTLSIKTMNAIYKDSVIVITLKDWSTLTTTGWTVKVGTTELFGYVSEKVWTSSSTSVEFASYSTITVKVSDGVRPAATTTTYQGFDTITVTKSSNTYLSWTSTADNTKTTFTDPISKKQTTSGASTWVYPNVAGSVDVYFGLSFTSKYLIPSGATISIDADFSSHEDAYLDLWSSHSFSSASVSSGALNIVLDEDLSASDKFEIVFDSALDISSSAITVDPVLVTVTCDDSSSTVVIKDTSTTGKTQVYKIESAPDAKITNFEYDSVSADAGFESWYSFNLTLGTASPDEFWVDLDFSGDFDAIPGPAYQLDDYGDDLLIPALDGKGDAALCFASHWIVSCYVSEAVAEEGTVSIWLYLKNGQTSGSVSAYITDSESNLLYKPVFSEDDQQVDFVNSLENSVDLYFVVSESTDDTNVEADLQLQAFVDIEAKAGETLWVAFPYPYDLELAQGSSVSCSLVYYNSDGTDDTVDLVIKKSECEVDGNMVSFTLAEDQTFTSANWTLFNVYGIETPSNGFTWVYEDQTVDYASGSFCILYSDSDDVFSGASFDNLNLAYTKLKKIGDYVRLIVNGGNNIAVTPGTISGPFILTSEDGDISAQLITIKGAEDVEVGEKATIVLSDNGSYSVDYIHFQAEIYVGAQTGASFGMYYIRWEIEETTFDGEDAQYLKPRATVVEVSYENTYELVFDVETIYVPSGYSSLPVTVSIDVTDRKVTPFSGVSVDFTPDNSSVNIEVSPNPLVIESGWPENYFVISCEDCVSGSSYTVKVTVEGDDAEAFYAVEQITFLYQSEYSAAAVIEVKLDNVTPIGFDYSISSDSRAIVTWALVCDDVKLDYKFTYDTILDQAFLYGAEKGATIQEYIDKILERYESAYENYDNYADIAYWLFRYGSEVAVPGQSLVEVGDNLIWTFDFLVPGLNYTVNTFVDNLSGQDPTENEQQARTSDMPPHAWLTIDFTDDDVDIEGLAQIIAKVIKWEATFIDLSIVRRRQMATSVSGYVYANPNSESSAYDKVNKNKASIKSAIGGTVTVTAISSDYYEDGEFIYAEFDANNGLILVFNYTVVEDGSIVCLIQKGSGIVEDTDAVYSGIASSGQDSDHYKIEVSAGETNYYIWNFTELGYEVGTYSVNCIACNAYPGDPSCSEVESTDYVYTATDDNGDSISAASILAAAFAAYLLI